MGVMVDLYEEIRSRIQNAVTNGELTSIKRVVMLPKAEARKDNDYPIINIWPGDTEDIPSCMHQGFVNSLVIDIQLIDKLLADPDNKLYKTSDSTGILFLYEDMLNALDKDLSGNIDLVFNGKANNLRQYATTIDHSESLIMFTTSIIVETKKYRAGNR